MSEVLGIVAELIHFIMDTYITFKRQKNKPEQNMLYV